MNEYAFKSIPNFEVMIPHAVSISWLLANVHDQNMTGLIATLFQWLHTSLVADKLCRMFSLRCGVSLSNAPESPLSHCLVGHERTLFHAAIFGLEKDFIQVKC